MKKCLLYGVLLMLVVSFFSACAKSVRYSPEEIKDYPPAVQEHIKQGEVALGMTVNQVRYAWGSPTTINVLPPAEDGKPREEWIYSSMGILMKRRLLFIDSKLEDIFPGPTTK